MPNNSKEVLVPIASTVITPEDSGPLTLEYALRKITGPEGEELYALRVDKRTNEGALVEREETPAITGSLEDATAIANAFAAGTVPPCVLIEMVDEWCSSLADAPG